MKLVPMICPQCGSPLKVDEYQTSFTCQFCDTTSVIDQEYVNPGDSRFLQMLKNGHAAFNKLKDYKAAFNYYNNAVQEKVDDFRGHAGLFYSLVAQYNEELPDNATFNLMRKYKDSALTFGSETQRNELIAYWNNLVDELNDRKTDAIIKVEDQWHFERTRKDQADFRITEAHSNISNAFDQRTLLETMLFNKRKKAKSHKYLIPLIIIGVVGLGISELLAPANLVAFIIEVILVAALMTGIGILIGTSRKRAVRKLEKQIQNLDSIVTQNNRVVSELSNYASYEAPRIIDDIGRKADEIRAYNYTK